MEDWISVDDRLPEDKLINWVLVGRSEDAGCPSAMQALFQDGRFKVLDGLKGGMSEFIDPTHWMPMPRPPK